MGMDLSSTTRQFEYPNATSGRRIRLIKVSPGLESEQLAFSISEFELEQSPPFTALSYVWGNVQHKKVALCNDCSFNITNSLYVALSQVRLNGQQEHIWADAVCINQNDIVEKTEQVRMMGDIYESAECVLIWLGPEEPGDRAGLHLMLELAHVMRQEYENPGEAVGFDDTRLNSIPSEIWAGMITFMKKPWFWRMWVLQEYQKSKKQIFQCGKMVMEAGFFWDFYYQVGRSPQWLQLICIKGLVIQTGDQQALFGPFFEIQQVFDVLKLTESKLPLHEILSRTRGCQATDPRDRVFAVVGMSSDSGVDIIDYEAQLSTILTNISTNRIQAILASPSVSDVFDYLCMVHHSDVEDLPSWVPSFYLPQSFSGLQSIFKTEKTRNSTPKIHLADHNALDIDGFIMDHIKTIIDIDQTTKGITKIKDGNYKDAFERADQIIKFYDELWDLAMLQMPYHTKEDPVDVYWKTLVFDTGDIQEQRKSTSEIRKSFESFQECMRLVRVEMRICMQYLNGDLPLPTQAQILKELEDATPYLKWKPSSFTPENVVDKAFLTDMKTYVTQETLNQFAFTRPSGKFIMDRRYFASNKEYLGWVPSHAREGDQICAFYGSRYPFVIRPCGDGWKLIGACFMHGLMEGEAFESLETRDIKRQTIKLV